MGKKIVRRKSMKIGLVLEGGAKRGAFTAGVLENLQDMRKDWAYVIGVSAGGGNAFNYLSGDNQRTMKVIDPGRKNAYIGVGNFVKSGNYVNLNKMVFEYSYKQFPVKFKDYYNNPVHDEYVALCCETGKAEYLHERRDENRLLNIIKATCSIPILCDAVEIDGKHYLDGSVIDAIPYERALQFCDKVVVVMTRTASAKPTNYEAFGKIIARIYKKYPATVDCLMRRTERYNEQLKGLNEGVKDGKIFLLRPEFNLSKFEKNKDKLAAFFNHGFEMMKEREDEFKEFING